MAEEKYVSGEAYQEMHRSGASTKTKSGKKVTIKTQTIGLVLAAIALCGLSFASGVGYQKQHTKVLTAALGASTNGFGPGGGISSRRLGDFGQVTSVSSGSITVNNQRSGSAKTYSITADTIITNNGQAASVTDIQTGDTVIISISSADNSVATRILVNPSFGGAAPNSNDN